MVDAATGAATGVAVIVVRGAHPAVLPCLPVEGGLALRPLAVLSPPNNGRLFFLFGADGMVVVACVGVQGRGWLARDGVVAEAGAWRQWGGGVGHEGGRQIARERWDGVGWLGAHRKGHTLPYLPPKRQRAAYYSYDGLPSSSSVL